MIPIQRRVPLLGLDPDYSKAFYPDPPSHDFLVWLVIAELMRRHYKAPAPLKVRFGLIKGRLGVYDYGPKGILDGKAWPCDVDRAYYQTMLINVLRPAINMIGAVEEHPAFDSPWKLSQLERYCEWDYHIGPLVDAAKLGYRLPQFSAPVWAHEEVREFLRSLGPKPVVITLRETRAQPERNSRIEDWLRFAASIARDHPILFLRDTARAEDQLSVFPTWPRASRNAYVRCALYSQAFVSMMVSNGPIGWCQFTDASFLSFKQLVTALPDWAHGQPLGWRDQAHLEVGDQYPWSSPRQRLTWMDDTFDELTKAFEAFLEVDAGYESFQASHPHQVSRAAPGAS